jgi:hypothetical protein
MKKWPHKRVVSFEGDNLTKFTDLMRADFGGIFIRAMVSFEGDNLTKIY